MSADHHHGHPLIPFTCGCCGRVLDCHDEVSDPTATPDDGDVSICAHCGAIGVYEGRSLRAPTEAEAAELVADPRLAAATTAFGVASSVDEAIAIWRRTHARSN